ncbi:putative leucine-rich repeat receptor-like protein kinase [Camellia lanceoleosa]|uniref:Leucine-rich repeat receptor-like protein kinase n=1 Tax=Camellia lanceoleosa TaxID=1840588 RepID=A0ACC0IVH3_9ERIC|nr:putative leucine-rich repeat receptor-like protein kinase [Camellia lanceoleosa]
MLHFLNLSRNLLSGSLLIQLGEFKYLELISLQDNNLTGEIPTQLGQLTSLMVLDLSQNALTGSIPESLANATSLQVVLLDHNRLSGGELKSFSKLLNLIQLDLSFNNLSVIVLFPLIGRGKLSRLTSLKKKVVTFAYAPTELNYDNVGRATGNFSNVTLTHGAFITKHHGLVVLHTTSGCMQFALKFPIFFAFDQSDKLPHAPFSFCRINQHAIEAAKQIGSLMLVLAV